MTCVIIWLSKRASECCKQLLQAFVKYAGESLRLSALAVGTLEGVSPAELAGLDLAQVEARCGPLDLLGLQVLSNHLRPGSRETVTNLQDKSVSPSHPVVIPRHAHKCTGMHATCVCE